MTATDELRRLLDERGVEWRKTPHYSSESQDNETVFAGDGIEWYANDHLNGRLGLRAARYEVTPEQAIEATLGVTGKVSEKDSDGCGECRVDVLNTGDCAGYECSEYIMHCNARGHEFGHVLYNEDGDVWMSEPPNFCPNCGRKVVDE